MDVVRKYLEDTGLEKVINGYFNDLLSLAELPNSPYPELLRRFRIEEQQNVFSSLEDDAVTFDGFTNALEVSPELSGVTCARGSQGVWGLPHVMKMVDCSHLMRVKEIVHSNENLLKAALMTTVKSDYSLCVWISLDSPAALSGKLIRGGVGEMQVTVNVEVSSKNFEGAVVDHFLEVVLSDLFAAEGNDQILLLTIAVETPRRQGSNAFNRQEWAAHCIHCDPAYFASEVKAVIHMHPEITMEYILVSPQGFSQDLGGALLRVKRRFVLHYRGAHRARSFTRYPFDQLATGIFFSRSEAEGYGEFCRQQGLSFASDGIPHAQKMLARTVEQAKARGDTLDTHMALLPLALLASVQEHKKRSDSTPHKALVDVARVTRGAGVRHRSLRNTCELIRIVLGKLVKWVNGEELPLLRTPAPVLDLGPTLNEEESRRDRNQQGEGHKCTEQIFQVWLRKLHLAFWAWRKDVLLYLESDHHSDVMVLKKKVNLVLSVITNIEAKALKLPLPHWHKCGNTISQGIGQGRDGFNIAARSLDKRLGWLSAWLHCVDLSLSWDIGKVCARVHAIHKAQNPGGFTHHNPLKVVPGLGMASRHQPLTVLQVPTTQSLLGLQQEWLEEAAENQLGTAAVDHTTKTRPGRLLDRWRGKGKATSHRTTHRAQTGSNKFGTSTSRGVSIKAAVLKTLREDATREVIAIESTLLQYVTDNRLDQCLHEVLAGVVTSALIPNPFPIITHSLAQWAMRQLLFRGFDSPLAWVPREACTYSVIAPLHNLAHDVLTLPCGVEKGSSSRGAVFGSRSALRIVDPNVALSLLASLPNIVTLAKEKIQLRDDDSCILVEVGTGICGVSQMLGAYTPHTTPSELEVVVPCFYEVNRQGGLEVYQYFSQFCVHFATAANNHTDLVVIGMATKKIPVGEWYAFSCNISVTEGTEDRFPLKQLLEGKDDILRSLSRLAPQQLVLHALSSFRYTDAEPQGGAKPLVPLLLRLVLVQEGAGRSTQSQNIEGTAAMSRELFFEPVYGTGEAARRVATYLAGLNELNAAKLHAETLQASVRDAVGRLDYLEGYRRLLRLQNMRLGEVKGARHVADQGQNDIEPIEEQGQKKYPEQRVKEVDRKNWEEEQEGGKRDRGSKIACMLRGPAEQLDHMCCALQVLQVVLGACSGGPGLPFGLESQLGIKAISYHTTYTVSNLLETLAEQPPARFEGAVNSLKIRAQSLIDKIQE
ncbi:unnamed protein product, partial [Choristocarpus tenellus]